MAPVISHLKNGTGNWTRLLNKWAPIHCHTPFIELEHSLYTRNDQNALSFG